MTGPSFQGEGTSFVLWSTERCSVDGSRKFHLPIVSFIFHDVILGYTGNLRALEARGSPMFVPPQSPKPMLWHYVCRAP